MRLRAVCLITILGLAIASCGGGGGSASSAKSANNFCASLKAFAAKYGEKTPKNNDPQEIVRAAADFDRLTKQAPSQVKSDVQLVNSELQTIASAVRKAGNDPKKIFGAMFEAALGAGANGNAEKMRAAEPRVQQYAKDTCGIDFTATPSIGSAGSDQTETTAAPTVRPATPVQPPDANAAARMLAGFLKATYSNDTHVGSLWIPAPKVVDTSVDVEVFAFTTADLVRACATFDRAAGYFFGGKQYALTLHPMESRGGAVESNMSLSPMTCAVSPKVDTDPVAATRPAKAEDRASRAGKFLGQYEGEWFTGSGSGSANGGAVSFSYTTKDGDPRAHCGEVDAVVAWFMGGAPYTLQVAQDTDGGDANYVDCG